MFKSIFYIYKPAFAKTVVYMLQSVEYKPWPYLGWLWSVSDFGRVIYRRNLVATKPAKLLLAAFRIGFLIQVVASLALLILGISNSSFSEALYGVALFLAAPIVWAHLIILPLALGDWLLIRPLYAWQVQRAAKIFKNHPAVKIAIAGSYGKTTMKEILLTVLSEGKAVKATPANRNVSISHARFAAGLSGNEDILIIEYGEGAPGDVARFAEKTYPDVGVITGLAPAHLDRYKTLQAAGQDIFSLAGYLNNKEVYVNAESEAAAPFIKKSYVTFGLAGIDNWKVKNIKNSLDGLSFELSGPQIKLKIKSRLLGKHLVGPLVLAAYLAHKYGLSVKQIEAGIAKIEPFEHRMKPYQISGAWIIDDTYNGNIEGMKAGLALLKELPAKRKIYITPGLVDQGEEEHKIHVQLGKAIADADPDQTVLMKHSVTDAIVEGLAGYKGQLIIEDDPLDFYTNLDKFVAAGDVVLMQNDWPDNYN